MDQLWHPTFLTKVLSIDHICQVEMNFLWFWHQSQCQKLKKIIGHLKDGSPGIDSVTSKSLKCISDHIALPFSRLANLSLSEGIFPNELEIAQVSPMYKAKDAMLFSNYQPISLLSIFSKILEKLMHDRLLDFLNKNRILNKYQFGFRNIHSTYMAQVILLENLRNALDSGECAIGIVLISKKHLIWLIIVSY